MFLTWEPEDRAKVIAWALESAARCSSCGTAAWEWEADPYAYMPVTTTCQGCARKDLMRDDSERPGAGVSIVLVPQAVGEAMMAGRVAVQERRRARDAAAEEESG